MKCLSKALLLWAFLSFFKSNNYLTMDRSLTVVSWFLGIIKWSSIKRITRVQMSKNLCFWFRDKISWRQSLNQLFFFLIKVYMITRQLHECLQSKEKPGSSFDTQDLQRRAPLEDKNLPAEGIPLHYDMTLRSYLKDKWPGAKELEDGWYPQLSKVKVDNKQEKMVLTSLYGTTNASKRREQRKEKMLKRVVLLFW